MSTVYDFKKQLAVGNKGEELFLKYHPDIQRLDGRKGDFMGFTNQKIELKTDSRTCKQTPNLFIERYRNDKKDAGGPWQAKEHEVHWFVYMFADTFIYWFEVEELIKFLEENKFPSRSIQNRGWSAMGYLVPRAAVEHLIVKKEKLADRESA